MHGYIEQDQWSPHPHKQNHSRTSVRKRLVLSGTKKYHEASYSSYFTMLSRLSRLVSFYFLWVGWDWVHLVREPLIGLLYQPRIIDDDESGAVSGMRIGRGNRSTGRKPAPVPLCPPQVPNYLTWARTRATAVGSRWLTAWAMERPWLSRLHYIESDTAGWFWTENLEGCESCCSIFRGNIRCHWIDWRRKREPSPITASP
jgi:hypothetical protein